MGTPGASSAASSPDMRLLIEYIAKALVDAPDEVNVQEVQEDDTTVLELSVAAGDVGKVIGKQGRTAAALRTLASSAGEREGKQVTLEIRESR